MDITMPTLDYIATMGDYIHCGELESCWKCKAAQHICGHSYIPPHYEKYPLLHQFWVNNRTLPRPAFPTIREVDKELAQMMLDPELPPTTTISDLSF